MGTNPRRTEAPALRFSHASHLKLACLLGVLYSLSVIQAQDVHSRCGNLTPSPTLTPFVQPLPIPVEIDISTGSQLTLGAYKISQVRILRVLACTALCQKPRVQNTQLKYNSGRSMQLNGSLVPEGIPIEPVLCLSSTVRHAFSLIRGCIIGADFQMGTCYQMNTFCTTACLQKSYNSCK